MEAYEKNLHINDSAFEKMRADADTVLQRLIKNMVEKDSMEGKVTITIDVSLIQEFIPNRDPNIEGETRRVLTPKISHKVGSVMQIKNETKGDTSCDGMELVYDEEKKEYVLKPIANTEQMTIFDAEFVECVNDDLEESVTEELVLEGRRVAQLPGPSAEDAEVEIEDAEEEGFTGMPIPFGDEYDDDLEYEDPEEY